MYIPIDPIRDIKAWDNLKQGLNNSSVCWVVSNGVLVKNLDTKMLSEAEIDGLVNQLKHYSYIRLGTSRSESMPAHFAIDLNGKSGILKEYVALSSEGSRLKNDAMLIAQFVFFEIKQLESLTIPFVVDFKDDVEFIFHIDSDLKQTEITRKNNK